MIETRFILGLFPIQAYVYNWVYTVAQIELLLNDKPLVLYKDRDDKTSTPSSNTPSKAEADEAFDEWMAKKKLKRENNKGKKMELNKWIQNG